MVKKATLDILEIAPNEHEVTIPDDEGIAENGEDDASVEKISGAGYLSKAIGWLRKPLFWIILMSVVYIGSVTGILVGFYQTMDGDAPALRTKQAVSKIPSSTANRGTTFNGIVVDQKDEHGNVRIVFCDVAIEFRKTDLADDINDDRVDVRSMIYTVLKKEGAQEGLSPEGRSRLKDKLKNELNSLLGDNLVTDVYFTNYELD